MNQLMHGPKLAGQSIADRVMAARHSISGQGLAKSVCKATTEEVMGPKKKHLDYLIQCTNEPNVSIPQLANLMIERTQSSSWCVVFKSLVSIHNLMNYGNERFTQYLASNNCTFNLNSFIDKTAVQGYDMSTYIRRYAKYLNEKCLSYRSMAFDFCKVKRGKDDGLLRTMSHEKLLKSIPVLQQQLDALLEFDVTPNELTNGVINAAFMLLFKDLIRLFACYNDGIINLLEKYFEMNKKHAREALDIYKKFLVRMERVGEILKVAESVGIDKGDIPDLAKAPSSLLEALEEHLKSLESSKKSGKHKSKEVTSAIDSFTQAANAAAAGVNASAISEDEKRRILEEESRALDQLRREKLNSPNSQPAASTNPFSTAAAPTDNSVDLFAGTGGGGDDLLALSGPNPFAESVITASQAPPAQASNPFAQTAMAPAPASTAQWGAPPPQPTGASAINSSSQQTTVTTTTTATNHTQFASDEAFAKAFGNATQNQQGGSMIPAPANPPPGFDGFGEVMMPMSMGGQNMSMGQQQQPLQVHPQPMMQQKKQDKLISGDLDSSLASLAGNLNMKGSSQVKKTEYNWTSGGGGPAKMTGAGTGGGWQTTTASTGFTQPMAQPMGITMGSSMAMYPGPMGPRSPVFALNGAYQNGNAWAGQPGMGMGYQQPPMMGGFQQQPMAMGQQRPMGMQQPMWGGGGQPMQPQSQTGVGGFGPPPATNSQANDPFGAL